MKSMLCKGIVALTTYAALGTLLAGCSWSIGGGKERVTAAPPTRGQELIDLKRARDQGAITQEEYENQRRQVLTR